MAKTFSEKSWLQRLPYVGRLFGSGVTEDRTSAIANARDFATQELAPALSTRGGQVSSASGPRHRPPPKGTYATYRKIVKHPTCALVRSIIVNPIATAPWGYKKVNESVPSAWVDLVEKNFDDLRGQLMADALRAIDYGWAPFEPIRKRLGDLVVFDRFKPLLPDITDPIEDEHGNIVGLENRCLDEPVVHLDGPDFWLWTYDKQFGDPYGNPRAENVRMDWARWVEAAEKLRRFWNKATASNLIIHHPDGTSTDAAGATKPNAWIAQWIAQELSDGSAVGVPNLFSSMPEQSAAAMRIMADLAGKSQWQFELLKGVETDFAASIIEYLAYQDRLIFRGYLRPERSGLEAVHGTRADARAHSDTGTVDSTALSQSIATAVTQGPVNNLLVQNFGRKARGSVRIDAAPIEEDAIDTYKTIFESALKDPAIAPVLLGYINLPALADDLNVPLVESRRGEMEIGMLPLEQPFVAPPKGSVTQAERIASLKSGAAQPRPGERIPEPVSGNGNGH